MVAVILSDSEGPHSSNGLGRGAIARRGWLGARGGFDGGPHLPRAALGTTQAGLVSGARDRAALSWTCVASGREAGCRSALRVERRPGLWDARAP